MSPNHKSKASYMGGPRRARFKPTDNTPRSLTIRDVKKAAARAGATIDHEGSIVGANRKQVEFLAPAGKVWPHGDHLLSVDWPIGARFARPRDEYFRKRIEVIGSTLEDCPARAKGTCSLCEKLGRIH